MPLRPPKGFIDESDPRVCLIGHPAPAWLVNYADLMTELVCFFVILYALSASLDKGMQKGAEEIEKKIKEQGISGEAKLTKEGLVIQLTEKSGPANFKSGFSELTPSMERTLAALAPDIKILAQGDRQVVVQGYTDDIPIKNDFFWSNWELSTARATTVLEHLIDKHGMPPACMAAMGFGEHQPECREKTAECRAKNRRVVILVRNSGLEKSACTPPGAVAPGGDPAAVVSPAAPDGAAVNAVPPSKDSE